MAYGSIPVEPSSFHSKLYSLQACETEFDIQSSSKVLQMEWWEKIANMG